LSCLDFNVRFQKFFERQASAGANSSICKRVKRNLTLAFVAGNIGSNLSLLQVIAGGTKLSKVILLCQSQLKGLGIEILRHQTKLLTYRKGNGEECR
jgi:hypothetical protein